MGCNILRRIGVVSKVVFFICNIGVQEELLTKLYNNAPLLRVITDWKRS